MAVLPVACEPFSAKFPVTGNNTGNFLTPVERCMPESRDFLGLASRLAPLAQIPNRDLAESDRDLHSL
jgi:hypothetical protein